MELELGLALPVLDPRSGFDLNRNGCDEKEVLGLELKNFLCVQSKRHAKHKRDFEEAFCKSKVSSKDLSLLVWSGHPNEEDDDGKDDTNKRSSCSILSNAGEENKVVGWPPVKSWRKRHLHQLHPGPNHYRHRINEIEDDGIVFNPIYVKVKMEGVPIGRKIDVGLYNSYQTLKTALIDMFANSCYKRCENSNASFTLIYEDKEGDWLLAGDLPWQTFLESVQCMKIIRRRSSN